MSSRLTISVDVRCPSERGYRSGEDELREKSDSTRTAETGLVDFEFIADAVPSTDEAAAAMER